MHEYSREARVDVEAPDHHAVVVSADGAHACVIDGVTATFDRTIEVAVPGAIAVAAPEGAVWILATRHGEHVLHRFSPSGVELHAPVTLGVLGEIATFVASRVGPRVALVEGEHAVLVREQPDGSVVVTSQGARGPDRRILLAGRDLFGLLERRGPALVPTTSGTVPELRLPAELGGARVRSGAALFDGTAVAIEIESRGKRHLLVFGRKGELLSHARVGDASILAIAEHRGLVVIGRGSHLGLLDLRAGRCTRERIMPAAVVGVAIGAAGDRLFVLDARGLIHALASTLSDLEAGETGGAEHEEQRHDEDENETEDALVVERAAPAAPPVVEPPVTIPQRQTLELELDHAELGALRAAGTAEPLALDQLDRYLGDVRAWVAARCRTVISAAADAGRLRSDPTAVLEALLAPTPGHATQRLQQAREAEREAAQRLARWSELGPHAVLERELGLSPMAVTIVLLVAAPHLWSDIARVYRAMVEPGRELVDEMLLGELLGTHAAARAAIGRELDAGSPLIRSGALGIGTGLRPEAGLAVHPLVLRRLAGERLMPPPGAMRIADRTLAQIAAPPGAVAQLVRELATPCELPVRIALRGRPGSGRRTLAAALAKAAHRTLALIEVGRGCDHIDTSLVHALRDAALRGCLPCVSIDELVEEPALRERVRAVLDAHPGPLVIRAALDQSLPLSPGHVGLDLAPLSEGARCVCWIDSLSSRGLPTTAADRLAAKFAVGPGIIARACERARGATVDDLEARLEAAVRQHCGTQLGQLARRVERLARWDDLILPADMLDALRELVARVQYRRIVLEEWGLDHVASTARGVTALFQGGPGTGKTMAAGVLASALGYELWRVDLSKLTSHWLGETEKNLSRLFDAAEGGEVVLLFDEADSLFGKRSDVKSSNDRYANLEVNYLLQRLDEFTGIAILTTNFGTSIDPAFMRRLALHLQFPFPDEVDRERLWRAHLPDALPRRGEIDVGVLARDYELSGGLIRNIVLRAAYLAASTRTGLDQEGVIRAIKLEYASRGKLGTGRLE